MMNDMRAKKSTTLSIKFSHLLIAFFLVMGTFVASYSVKAHSVAVFIEIGNGTNGGSVGQVRFHALTWHWPSEFTGRYTNSGSMSVNGVFYAFTGGARSGPLPSTYRLVASCSGYQSYNNSSHAYQSTNWISGINLCQSMQFNMTSYYLEAPACNLSGSVDVSQPVFISQPTISPSSSFCQGTNFTISVVASGINLSYQWEVSSNGVNWSPLSNSGGYSNVTTASMTFTNSQASMSGLRYRCFVSSTGSCGTKTATSTPMSISVSSPTSVSSHPISSITACSNTSQSISAAGSGTNLRYQWFINGGSDISGATGATLNFTAGTSPYVNGAQIRCRITGTCGSVETNACTLAVNAVTSISSHPSSATVCEGSSRTFSVSAAGLNLTYQWQVSLSGGAFNNITSSNTLYSGATSATLTLNSAAASLSGARYQCIVSGSCGVPSSVTSSAATLTVNRAPAITSQAVSEASACVGANASFTVSTSGTSLSYEWQVNTDSTVSNSWSPVRVGGAYAISSTGIQSVLTVTPSAENMHRYRYRCIVSSGVSCGASVTSSTSVLNVFRAASISAQPTNLTPSICESTNTTFSFSATGTRLAFQWQIFNSSTNTWDNLSTGTNYLGVTSTTLSVNGAPTSLSGRSYRGVATGLCGVAANTSTITLTVDPVSRITSQPSSSTICSSSSATFSTTTSGASLVHMWQVSTNGGQTYSDITGGTFSSTSYSGHNTNTLSFTAANSLTNYRYRLKLDGQCGPTVLSNPATLTVHSAPSVSRSPVDTSGCIYGRTFIYLNNAGLGNTYQWQEAPAGTSSWTTLSDTKDPVTGFITTGVTTDSLKLFSLIEEKNGFLYRCIITPNPACGSAVTTSPVTLTVKLRPSITLQPVNANNNLNVSSPTATTYTFRTIAGGTLSAGALTNTFGWRVSTNGGQTWTPVSNGGGITYSVTNASSPNFTSILTAVYANTVTDRQKYLYRCLVAGDCGTTTTRLVTINPPPKVRDN